MTPRRSDQARGTESDGLRALPDPADPRAQQHSPEANEPVVAVLGGGPAGMSCALWLLRLGLAPVLIEPSEVLGGAQLLSPFENGWFLGTDGLTGYQLAERFSRHIEAASIPFVLGCPVAGIAKADHGFRIVAGPEFTVRCIVVATGQRVKGFQAVESIPGSRHLHDSPRVCFNPGATPGLVSRVSGSVVAVVGGGDNAMVTALHLGREAQHTHLFVRSGVRAFGVYRAAVLDLVAAGRITLHERAAIEAFDSSGSRISITFHDRGGQHQELLFDQLCFRLGFIPNAEEPVRLLERGGVGSLRLTDGGHIVTDQFLRTSLPSVYAVGDVANPRDPCVATAVAHGAIAARSIEEDLNKRDASDAGRDEEFRTVAHDEFLSLPPESAATRATTRQQS